MSIAWIRLVGSASLQSRLQAKARPRRGGCDDGQRRVGTAGCAAEANARAAAGAADARIWKPGNCERAVDAKLADFLPPLAGPGTTTIASWLLEVSLIGAMAPAASSPPVHPPSLWMNKSAATRDPRCARWQKRRPPRYRLSRAPQRPTPSSLVPCALALSTPIDLHLRSPTCISTSMRCMPSPPLITSMRLGAALFPLHAP